MSVVGGDFRVTVLPGADVDVLKSVVHDWDDHEAIAILARCRAALAPQAKLLLVEAIVRPMNEADQVKFFDLRMLVMNGGRERTASEFEDLCTAAGFRLSRIVATPSRFSVIEAVPI